jgi:hypothetical protein
VRGADAPPERGLNSLGFVLHIFQPHVRERIGQLERAIDRVGVIAVLEYWRRPARDDRRPANPMAPCHRQALRVETSRHAIVESGTIHIVLNVLLPRPDDLDRTVDLLPDGRGLRDEIHLEPPAEAAADQMVVDGDFLRRKSGDLGGHGLRPRNHLGADPDVAAVLPHVNGAVDRFHGSVGEEWELIDGVELRARASQRPGDVSFIAHDRAFRLRRLGHLGHDVSRCQLRVRAFVPLDLERFLAAPICSATTHTALSR